VNNQREEVAEEGIDCLLVYLAGHEPSRDLDGLSQPRLFRFTFSNTLSFVLSFINNFPLPLH
jgi:hypothetical protein